MSFESLPSFGSVFGEEYPFQTRTHVKDEKLCFNSFNSGKWTTREDEAFLRAVSIYGSEDINAILAAVQTRSKVQIRNRVVKWRLKQGNR